MSYTYDQFIQKHLGKAMDYDGCAGAQCVDLIKYYLDEVFGVKAGAWGDAHCYYDNFDNISALKNNFTKIANAPDFVPRKGDIVVWSPKLSSGGWGHIAIATGEGNTNYFYTYDQNWYGNHDKCAKIYHNYNCVYGVLRPKDQTKITGVTKPSNVTGFKAASTNASAIKLTWNKVSNADGYVVYRYNTSTKKYGRIAKGGNLAFTDKNLKAGTKYKYAIRSYKTVSGKEVLSPSYPEITASTTQNILDKSGCKINDKNNGVLAIKELLLLAYKLKLITVKVNKDNVFGSGTKSAINQLLKSWGYSQNGIAGSNFIKRLHTEIEKRM